MIDWIIGLIAFGVFVYFGPYKNVQKIQELWRIYKGFVFSNMNMYISSKKFKTL